MIYKEYSLSVSPHLTAKESPLFIGCEFEIEDIKELSEEVLMHVSVTDDGSLRNNGKEFITPPIPVPASVDTFVKLHEGLSYGVEAFSDRTSIHVHANCCNLFPQEVRNVVLLYALFEEAFFAMVDPKRRNNIHCVALTETHLPNNYRYTCNTLLAKWHKYTALNLKPLSTQGTIEFRHMHGHNDVALFKEWVGLIEKLFTYGRTFKPTSHTLEDKALEVMFNNLFGDTRLKDRWAEQRSLMDNQIIDVKMSTLS